MNLIWILTFAFVVEKYQNAEEDDIYQNQKSNEWFKDGVNLLNDNLKYKNINKKANGVIIFLGDGMSVPTVTAARILDGQLKGMKGEENMLSWETFKDVAFSKTYNTNQQVPDSAGTATAFMTGVKTNAGIISLSEKVTRGNCSLSKTNKVMSILEMAEKTGLSTGVVTTARLTHATPATAYSHSADRNWENDDETPDDCSDIASQLLDFPYGDGLEVALGGGRRNFLLNTTQDPEYSSQNGSRTDGRNLIEEWLGRGTFENNYDYVWRDKEFKALNPQKIDHVLGLFEPSHMQYEKNRPQDKGGEPSLTEMVQLAIKVLQKNPKGYFLLVESGRIDHGHHGNRAFHALHDTVELSNAVAAAKKLTNPDETLLVVTADHSHVFTMAGYQERGTPIFNYTKRVADDGMRYTTLGYANGPSGLMNKSREEPSILDLEDPDYKWSSLVPLYSETHGGDDVGIYAQGCQSHLIKGVVEQNYIFHVMDYALCLSENKKEICRKEGLIANGASTLTQIPFISLSSICLVFCTLILL